MISPAWTQVLDNAQSEISPIFVVGAPRSGTSLLGRIVGLSPDVAVFEETGLFSLVYARANPFKAHALQRRAGLYRANPLRFSAANLSDHLRGINRLESMLRRMLEYTRLGEYDLGPSRGLSDVQNVRLGLEDQQLLAALHAKYRSLMGRDLGAVMGVLLRDFRLLARKQRIVEKTPMHFLYLPPVFALFPEAKVIFISRDAKEVLASYVDTFSNRHVSWRRAARYIHGVWKQARRIQHFYEGDERVLGVEYDALLSDTEAIVGEIYEFAGVQLPAGVDTKLGAVRRTDSQWDQSGADRKAYIDRLLS